MYIITPVISNLDQHALCSACSQVGLVRCLVIVAAVSWAVAKLCVFNIDLETSPSPTVCCGRDHKG